jgi:hypothetical protein
MSNKHWAWRHFITDNQLFEITTYTRKHGVLHALVITRTSFGSCIFSMQQLVASAAVARHADWEAQDDYSNQTFLFTSEL